jgi:hypothetical protein
MYGPGNQGDNLVIPSMDIPGAIPAYDSASGASQLVTGPFGIPTAPMGVPPGSMDSITTRAGAAILNVNDISTRNWAQDPHTSPIQTSPNTSSGSYAAM